MNSCKSWPAAAAAGHGPVVQVDEAYHLPDLEAPEVEVTVEQVGHRQAAGHPQGEVTVKGRPIGKDGGLARAPGSKASLARARVL